MKQYLITILLCLTGFVKLSAQTYKNVPQKLIQNAVVSNTTVIPKNAYKLINALPKNCDKTGKVDYTAQIQKAMDKYRTLVFPPFPLKINVKGLNVSSNSNLYFLKGAQLEYTGLASGRFDDILKVYGVKNVKIFNPDIRGSKKSFSKQQGEWSAGIAIYDSKNVQVYNPVIKDTWGDGIVIGSNSISGPILSQNVIIKNGWIDNARRNGISITTVIGLKIDGILISNTYGTSPECAIQIEPSTQFEQLKDISIQNVTTFNSANTAFSVNTDLLCTNQQLPAKTVSIYAGNIRDFGSRTLLAFTMNPSNRTYYPNGEIIVENVDGVGNSGFNIYEDGGKSNIKVRMKKVRIKTDEKATFKTLYP